MPRFFRWLCLATSVVKPPKKQKSRPVGGFECLTKCHAYDWPLVLPASGGVFTLAVLRALQLELSRRSVPRTRQCPSSLPQAVFPLGLYQMVSVLKNGGSQRQMLGFMKLAQVAVKLRSALQVEPQQGCVMTSEGAGLGLAVQNDAGLPGVAALADVVFAT